MKRLRIIALTFFLSLLFTVQSSADVYGELWSDFDAGQLTYEEKRLLQTSLAFKGTYFGLLDGTWGQISQKSLEEYSKREFQSGAQKWHMAMLVFDFYSQLERDGWQIRYFDYLGLSFLFPEKAYSDGAPSQNFINWVHSNSSLGISVIVGDRDMTERLHVWTQKQHAKQAAAYAVRKTSLAVTSSEGRDGIMYYTRSNFINNAWSTVMLSALTKDKILLQTVSSSIAVGRSKPLVLPENGKLAQVVSSVLAYADQEKESPDPPMTIKGPTTPRETDQKRSSYSGTGFYVSSTGTVLTNAHVVSECAKIKVNGNNAEITGLSSDFDLALLSSQNAAKTPFASFSTTPAELNSDVTVAGYPLTGILDGLNVTRGAVSSLKGLGGNISNMQISAPLQPGNSGGPSHCGGGDAWGAG